MKSTLASLPASLLASLWFGLLLAAGASPAQEPSDPTTDVELRALIAEAAVTAGDEPAVVVLDRTRVRVEKSGLGHTDHRVVIQVRSDAAALDYTTLRFDYDPQSNVVEVKSVRVLHADGTVHAVSLENIVDLPQPQRSIYWGARMKLVRVPRMSSGDALEFRTYKKGFMIAYLGDDEDDRKKGPGADDRYIPPMRGHYYDVVAFGSRRPIHRKHYTVQTVRATPLQYEVYNGAVRARATVTADANVYSFWRERIPPFRAEPNAPRANDQLPKVVMATVRDWREKSKWFYRVNESQFDATPGIKAKVAELLEGKETDRDRVATIVHWCANEIRYSGVSMGDGEGYTIHPSAMTYRDRCGVCKDKAGLAVTMLREAGYTAHAAMTMAGERVESIPADQFNHCVLAIRLDEKVKIAADPANGVFTADRRYWLLDPTWVVFSPELWSSAESEQHVLIGTADGEDLMITPARPAAHNRLVIRGTSTLKRWTRRGPPDELHLLHLHPRGRPRRQRISSAPASTARATTGPTSWTFGSTWPSTRLRASSGGTQGAVPTRPLSPSWPTTSTTSSPSTSTTDSRSSWPGAPTISGCWPSARFWTTLEGRK